MLNKKQQLLPTSRNLNVPNKQRFVDESGRLTQYGLSLIRKLDAVYRAELEATTSSTTSLTNGVVVKHVEGGSVTADTTNTVYILTADNPTITFDPTDTDTTKTLWFSTPNSTVIANYINGAWTTSTIPKVFFE